MSSVYDENIMSISLGGEVHYENEVYPEELITDSVHITPSRDILRAVNIQLGSIRDHYANIP